MLIDIIKFSFFLRRYKTLWAFSRYCICYSDTFLLLYNTNDINCGSTNNDNHNIEEEGWKGVGEASLILY